MTDAASSYEVAYWTALIEESQYQVLAVMDHVAVARAYNRFEKGDQDKS